MAPPPQSLDVHPHEPGHGQVVLRPASSVVAPAEQVRNLYTDDGSKQVVKELTERVVAHHAAVKTPSSEWLQTFTSSGG